MINTISHALRITQRQWTRGFGTWPHNIFTYDAPTDRIRTHFILTQNPTTEHVNRLIDQFKKSPVGLFQIELPQNSLKDKERIASLLTILNERQSAIRIITEEKEESLMLSHANIRTAAEKLFQMNSKFPLKIR